MPVETCLEKCREVIRLKRLSYPRIMHRRTDRKQTVADAGTW
jgi:hypothetical protein